MLAQRVVRAPSSDRSAVFLVAIFATCALGAVAVYSPKYALGAVAGAVLVGLAFWRLALGVTVFTVLTFPEFLPGSLGAGATVAKPLGVVLAVAWLALVVARRGEFRLLPRDRPVIFWSATCFVLLAAASSLWAPSAGHVHYQLSRLVLAAVFLLVVYTAASSAEAFKSIIWGYLFGSVITSGYGIVTGGYGVHGRLNALFDPNYFAAELTPALLIAILLLMSNASRRTRIAAAVVIGFDAPAFALTQSRGGIVGLFIALVAGIVFAGRARPRIVVAVLLFAAVGMGYYAIYRPSHIAGSFSGGSFSSASSGRSDEWRIALRMFEHHPLNGVGLGNFVVLEPSYSTQSINLSFVNLVVNQPLVAHNAYLEVAAELGLGGLVLFVAVLGAAAAGAVRALPRFDRLDGPLGAYARGLVAGSMGLYAAIFFLSAEYKKQLWLVVGLLAVIPLLAGTVGRERARSAS